jgi:hypothetical protein
MSNFSCRIDSDPSLKCTGKAHLFLWVEDRRHTFIAEITDHNLDEVERLYGEEARRVVVSALRDALVNPHPLLSFDEGIVARYHPQNDWSRQTLNASVAAVMAKVA